MYTDAMSKDDITIGILVEHMNDQFDRVLEAIGEMKQQVDKLPSMESDIKDLKEDVKVIKAVVIDTSNQVHDHEHRITTLEQA